MMAMIVCSILFLLNKAQLMMKFIGSLGVHQNFNHGKSGPIQQLLYLWVPNKTHFFKYDLRRGRSGSANV